MNLKKIIYFLFLILLVACENEQNNYPVIDANQLKEALIERNINAVKKEQQQIEQYIKKHQLNPLKTGTGLHYQLIKQGEGEKAVEGQVAVISYEVTLLDGTQCYSTKEKGPEEFKVGKDNVESGLHEAITYLKKGDKAIVIIPSYLAHGLAGDFNKIPVRSTIIYTLELIEVK
ncbi:MAG: FKBP-type peptidyl-prolyl cis-trans isomerase [Vicingaceae bacterium]|nr:FKBP-type peptidyl-prolyl cis-trans isomerase [Vicingaceae bacterium]